MKIQMVRCAHCGQQFNRFRKDKRFHSAACRQAAYRKRKANRQ